MIFNDEGSIEGSINSTGRALAIALIAVLSCALARPAVACTVGAVNFTYLAKRSDIIAKGIIHVVRQTTKRNGDTDVTAGVLELRQPTVMKNRIGALHPFFFRFELIETDDGCIFGEFPPEEGDSVTVYLIRTTGSPRFALMHAQVHEHAPDADKDEDEHE